MNSYRPTLLHQCSNVETTKPPVRGGLTESGCRTSIIAVSTRNARVRRISPDGTITTVAGNGTPGYSGDGGAATAAQIAAPMGLAVDAADNLYIADSAAVRKISTAGIISTAAPFGGLGWRSTAAEIYSLWTTRKFA